MSRLTVFTLSFMACCQLFFMPATAGASLQGLIDEGTALYNRQEYAAALEKLHQAEQRLPDPEALGELIGIAYLGLGYQQLNEGEYDAALTAFESCEVSLADDVRLWQGKAVVYLHQGRHDEAEYALQTALGIDASQPQLYQLLGQALYARGEMAAAVDALRRAKELGGGEEIDALLAKVEAEWQIEREMQQDLGGRFRISYADDGQIDLAMDVLQTLEYAYAELGSELDYYPDVEVPVLLYGRKAFRAVTRSPDWAGAVYDGKIRIPLGGVREMTPALSGLLYHEYAHVLMRFLGKGRVPAWLNEGFAGMAQRRHDDPVLIQLESAISGDSLLDFSALDAGFTHLLESQVALAYEQSYAFCRYLVERYGEYRLRELVVRLGEGAPIEPAVAEVYADYALTFQSLQVEWRNSLYD